MTTHRQKRKSFHLDNDGFDDSNEADELSSLMMEKAEFLTVCAHQKQKVGTFRRVVESHESDKTQEEVELTWLTVS